MTRTCFEMKTFATLLDYTTMILKINLFIFLNVLNQLQAKLSQMILIFLFYSKNFHLWYRLFFFLWDFEDQEDDKSTASCFENIQLWVIECFHTFFEFKFCENIIWTYSYTYYWILWIKSLQIILNIRNKSAEKFLSAKIQYLKNNSVLWKFHSMNLLYEHISYGHSQNIHDVKCIWNYK